MPKFDYFVVFAEMRTGSNFLETNINAFDGLQCHGEAFNPHFIGYPDRTDILGVTLNAREGNPARLIERIKEKSEGLGGFRYFNDHDPRVFDIAVPDPRCAKIVLTRNPVESYVSWKIAQATGQWKLTNVKHAKSETVVFEAAEFEAHMDALQAFQVRLLNALQRTGQTAFYVAYEDLQDVEVMNGLAAYLGCPSRIEGLDKKLKKQNPEPMESKVSNFAAMEQALARLDRFNLTRTPNFEPRRGAVTPTYVAPPRAPVLFAPIKGGPVPAVMAWLAALDAVSTDALLTNFSQKSLRQWKRSAVGHRSFTVIRHPVARAHAAFCDHILPTGPGAFGEIRTTLRQQFKLPIPKDALGPEYDEAAHRAAFLAFLAFLKVNLAGQTSIRIDPVWASQAAIVQGFANFAAPDMILREDGLTTDLAILAAQIGRPDAPLQQGETDPHRPRLAAIYDRAVEDAARDAFLRDYMTFGFGDWA